MYDSAAAHMSYVRQAVVLECGFFEELHRYASYHLRFCGSLADIVRSINLLTYLVQFINAP